MKLIALAAAALIGGGLAFLAPTANAMPRGTAPVDVSKTTNVQKTHGRHCRIRRGHRSRCGRVRRGHAHSHRHRGFRHYHRHYSGHHRRYRPVRRYYRPVRRYYRPRIYYRY